MIKINLLRNAIATNKGKETDAELNIQMPRFEDDGGGGGGSLKQRLIILALPIVIVYGYSWFTMSSFNSRINLLNKESASIDAQIEALRPQLDTIEKLNAEKNKITTEVNAIKELSKKRYNDIKVLDALQSLIPERAWLTKMEIKDRTISIEGRANDDGTISNFMQNLEESAYFQNVTWDSSKEVTEPQGVVKMFNIHLTLENLP